MHPEASARNHRKQVRWIAASLIVVALLVAACSGTSGSGSNGDASAQVTTTTAVALEQPSVRCGAPRPGRP
jgi:predicted small secreted protein